MFSEYLPDLVTDTQRDRQTDKLRYIISQKSSQTNVGPRRGMVEMLRGQEIERLYILLSR